MTPTPDPSRSFETPIPALVALGGAPLYVTGEDALCVTVFNASAGVTVTVTGRMLQFGATRPSAFAQSIIPATDRSASVARFTLGDGWLLNAQVLVTVGAPAIGQTFARLSLVRGITANAPDLFTLCADYVTAKMPLSYPGSGVTDATDGAGAMRAITGATPAAGAEISETVPTGARWELLTFRFTLTSSVTVASRAPTITCDDGTNVYWAGSAIDPQAASSAFSWSAAAGLSRAGAPPLTQAVLPLPVGLKLTGGHRIKTVTASLQAGDQISAVQYLVREWIEGA